jgi:hypothetical protein
VKPKGRNRVLIGQTLAAFICVHSESAKQAWLVLVS